MRSTSASAAHAPVPPGGALLTDDDLKAIVRLIYARSGIVMDEEKRHLILNRLQRRLRALGMTTFRQYLQFVNSDSEAGKEEMGALVDALTTNHTRFFREPQHFDMIANDVVPVFMANGQTLKIWIAASSSGEEPYSLSMTLLEAGFSNYHIFASDLSTKVLREASDGVYSEARVASVPEELLHRWFQRGIGPHQGKVRVSPEMRQRITYAQVNLLEVGTMPEMFDLILCRTVMIYFDLGNRQRVVSMLERHLKPGGYLFLGLCESLTGIQHGLKSAGPAAFRKGAE